MEFTGLLGALAVVSRCDSHGGDGSVAWAKVRRVHWARLRSNNGGFTGAVALGQMFVYGPDQADSGAQGCDTGTTRHDIDGELTFTLTLTVTSDTAG